MYLCSSAYSLNGHRGAVFHKLCRTVWLWRVHRPELVSAIVHVWLVAVSSTGRTGNVKTYLTIIFCSGVRYCKVTMHCRMEMTSLIDAVTGMHISACCRNLKDTRLVLCYLLNGSQCSGFEGHQWCEFRFQSMILAAVLSNLFCRAWTWMVATRWRTLLQ